MLLLVMEREYMIHHTQTRSLQVNIQEYLHRHFLVHICILMSPT